jgi:hypothetical protein
MDVCCGRLSDIMSYYDAACMEKIICIDKDEEALEIAKSKILFFSPIKG